MSDIEGDRPRDMKRDRRSRGPEQSRERSLDRGKDRGAMKASPNRVFVSNIPYEFRWQDLKDLFRSQVGDVSFVELFVDDNEKPRGCGVVEFAEVDSVKKCLEVMHRFELKGRKLVIKEDFGARDKFGNSGSGGIKRPRDREESRDRRFRDDRRGGGGYDHGRSLQDGGNTFGLSPQFLESLGINSPLINRLFIANLDYKVDKKKLKEVFRLAGKIQKIDLSQDKDGKSRGFAVLEFDHPVEAVQAISMFHNQVLYDRVMTVRMDREGDRPIVKLPDGLKGIGMGLGVNGDPLRDVARNLPSLNNSLSQGPGGAGGGILGSVPPLGLGNALGNLTSASSALNNLNTNAAVLQAANLAGVGSLSSLANSLGGGDLGLASLVQNQSLAALAGSGNLGSGSLNNANYSRNENSYIGGGSQSNQNYLSGGGRGFDDQKGSRFSYQSDSEARSGNSNVYSSAVNNGNSILRNQSGTIGGKGSGYSNKVLISNLPPTASYKMLSEKCNEFGEVQRIEDKGSSGVLVAFASEWEAERAIKNMDRARIDGRTIEVRFFY